MGEREHGAPANVLVLGFYDRANLGDEIYKEALARFVPGARFVCTDDINQLQEKDLTAFDFVVCGGGDIVNSYFMQNIKALVKRLRVPCYAVSVGLPYPSDAHYFSMFDHVIVRSKSDAFFAMREMGQHNITCLPDLAFALPLPQSVPSCTGRPCPSPQKQKGPIKIGVCLAQPMFARASHADHLVQQMVRFLTTLVASMDAELYLFSFNTGKNPAESDLPLNQTLAASYYRTRAHGRHIHLVDPQHTATFGSMCHMLDLMDVVIGSRYHSIVLAMALRKPFLAIYTSRKINNLLLDHDLLDHGVQLQVDARDQPVDFPVEQLVDAAADALTRRHTPPTTLRQKEVARRYANELQHLFASNKRKTINVNTLSHTMGKLQRDTRSLEACMQKLSTLLAAFLGMARVNPPPTLEALVQSAAYRQRTATSDGALTVARIVCYAMTRNLTSPYLWGLLHKLDPAQVISSAQWIYHDHHVRQPSDLHLHLPLVDLPKRATPHPQRWVDLYYFQQSDFKGAHRSGWDYVTTALHAFEAELFQRYPDLILDTYVDRTFHWGHEVLALDRKLPYGKPWIGFVHHTFDESHSTYNCQALLRSPLFLESLTTCRGLIVLSQALHRQWIVRLSELGRKEVPVFQLYHPTEFPSRRFSIWKFWRNPQRRLLQIGAWLRNPYALYDLPLPLPFPLEGRGRLQKTALRGRDMDQSFPPPYLHAWLTQRRQQQHPQTGEGNDALEGCRTNPLSPGGNAYMEGLVKSILEKNASVEVLQHVTNEAYDALLSENVVFLSLVDASAVNTVIECIVRNTPIYVNRLPALEEVLGPRYPGFYHDLQHAVQLIQKPGHILKTHLWLRFCVNKTKFRQSTFLSEFNAILSQCSPDDALP